MMQYLDWLDLLVFVGMLLLSAIIGVYFAYFAKEKQNTSSQYLMGGRTMDIFPVSMSLIARCANDHLFVNLSVEFSYMYVVYFCYCRMCTIITPRRYLRIHYDCELVVTYSIQLLSLGR